METIGNYQKVTFDQLPAMVEAQTKKLDQIYSLITGEKKETDPLLTIEQLCDYLPEKPAKQTVYGWANNRQVPYEKHGRRLYFRRSAIDCWLSDGRQMKRQKN